VAALLVVNSRASFRSSEWRRAAIQRDGRHIVTALLSRKRNHQSLRRWQAAAARLATVMPNTCAACNQVNWRASTFMITSRRVIARTSRRTRRSMFSIVRLYPTGRTSLNVYAPDIPNVYDITSASRHAASADVL